jgi:drug/metabolite transporter (DMT)-like permease
LYIIKMLKAFTPVAVLALSVLTGLEKSTCMEIKIIALISLGVALASVGEQRFSWIGFACQAIGLLSESGRLVLTNILLKKLKLDSLTTLYYLAPLCFVLNLLAFSIFELPLMDWSVFDEKFIGILLLNGAVSFSLNIASVMLILHTSALVLTLSGVIKDCLLIVLSLVIFGSPVSILQYLGYAVALLALNLHMDYKKIAALFPTAFGLPPVQLVDEVSKLESQSLLKSTDDTREDDNH